MQANHNHTHLVSQLPRLRHTLKIFRSVSIQTSSTAFATSVDCRSTAPLRDRRLGGGEKSERRGASELLEAEIDGLEAGYKNTCFFFEFYDVLKQPYGKTLLFGSFCLVQIFVFISELGLHFGSRVLAFLLSKNKVREFEEHRKHIQLLIHLYDILNMIWIYI